MRVILVFIFLLVLNACSSKKEDEKALLNTVGQENAKPSIKHAGKPELFLWKSLEKAEKVAISTSNLFQVNEGYDNTSAANFNVPLKKFTSENGLGINAVICGYCDSRGNLWFGTNGGGVSFYNGQTFVNLTANQGLADNIVRCITEDASGNMWFGTRGGGISCYDGFRFRNFTTQEGLSNSDVRSLLVSRNGNLWIGTEGGGLNIMKPGVAGIGGKIEKFDFDGKPESSTIQCIYEDSRGLIWTGSNSKGASAFDPSGKNKHSFLHFDLQSGLTDSSVTCVLQDKAGDIWLGTNRGLSRYNGKHFITYTTNDGLADNSILCLLQDLAGKIWIGTQNGGVSCFDPTAEPVSGRKAFHNFNTENGLPNNQIYSITKDRCGSLWFGSWGGGVVQYSGNSISRLMALDGSENIKVVSLAEDKTGGLWFFNQHNLLTRFKEEEIAVFTNETIRKFGVVRGAITDRKGNLWFATSGAGVCRFDGQYLECYTINQGLVGNNTRSVFEDSKGRIWVGSFKQGVSCIQGDSILNYTTAQGLSSNEVWNIMEDRKGNIWFSTHGGGASCFTGKEFRNYSTEQGLPSNVIWNVTQDDAGNLWFASDGGGISRFDGETFYTISVAQGLGDDVILSTRYAQDGSIWMGTNKGFSVIRMFVQSNDSVSKIEKPVSATTSFTNRELNSKGFVPQVDIYNKKTGFAVEDLYPNSLFFDRHGIVWAGTSDGLVRFDYRSIRSGNQLPTIELHAIRINNEKMCWHDLSEEKNLNQADSLNIPTNINEEVAVWGRSLTETERSLFRKKFGDIRFSKISGFYPLPQQLEIPYRLNNISIDFGAIETSRPSLVRYQYKLEGYDNDWSPVSEKASANFGNISEGTYVFKVKARGPEGIWSKTCEYSFVVLPPWYRTWWALAAYILIGCGILVLLFRWRTLALVLEKRKLEGLVNERTTEVVLQKEIVEYKNREILASIKYAKRIQTAILPSGRTIKQNLPESFILYLPKDIVAGDFYWIEKTGNHVLFAACDCTGHGVPGAMVSVVCNNALNRAVREFGLQKPAEILDKVAKLVIENFSTSDDSIEDGMDISLCSYNIITHELQWAGANNPLWIIRKGELIIYHPDKQPVGLHENPLPFTNHTIQLEKDDQLYIFSDGFADQFGGEEREKKLTRKRFRELILSVSSKDIKAQGDYLESFIVNYRNGLMQIDDILIIGVRI